MPNADGSLRILWLSNAPWTPTGYGNQTGLMMSRLKRAGHSVAGLYYYGYAGPKAKIEGHQVYGLHENPWGNDALPYDQKDFGADITISLMDVWVLDEHLGGSQGMRFCPWLPVDHAPAPPQVVARLVDAYRPIAMSKFGQEQLHEAGVPADYIPHGIDTEKYRPMRSRNREMKRWLGFDDDCFLVTMVAANKGWPSRKGFPEAFEAFHDFQLAYPKVKARLYVHTAKDDRWGGPPLDGLAQDMDIDPKHIRFPNLEPFLNGFTTAQMRRLYNAADVLLNPSYGEGFGIPIVEAQACGTPVIVTDFSSMPELVGAGWTVQVERRWWTPLRAFQALPSVDSIAENLAEAHEVWRKPKERREMAQEARTFALQYDADTVFENYWKPWLEQVAFEVSTSSLENPRKESHELHEGMRPVSNEPIPIHQAAAAAND